MTELNLFFFDIDGVLLPIKWYPTRDIPNHIYGFIKHLQQDRKNKIIMSTSRCHDDFDLFKLLKDNNLSIDWKLNGDVLFKWSNISYKEKYIAEFIHRDNYLNNHEYNNIVILDDEDININNIQSILSSEYKLNLDIKKFLKIKTNPSMWIMGQEIKTVLRQIYNIKDTDFESIKGLVKDIKISSDNRSILFFTDNKDKKKVFNFFKDRYKEKEIYSDCIDNNKNDCEEQDIFKHLGYEEPSLIKYSFMWNEYDCISLWYDRDKDILDTALFYFNNKTI